MPPGFAVMFKQHFEISLMTHVGRGFVMPLRRPRVCHAIVFVLLPPIAARVTALSFQFYGMPLSSPLPLRTLIDHYAGGEDARALRAIRMPQICAMSAVRAPNIPHRQNMFDALFDCPLMRVSRAERRNEGERGGVKMMRAADVMRCDSARLR